MPSSSKGVHNYIKFYKERSGREISPKEAEEHLNNLTGFFKILIEIDKRNN